MKTIEEAKAHLRKNFDAGLNCPCCNQKVKRYKRKLGTSPASCLIILYKLYVKSGMDKSKFFHIKEIGAETSNYPFKGYIGGDFAKAQWWGLIEEMPKDEDDTKKRTSGFWRITKRGRLFVNGRITIPEYSLSYNGKCLGFEGDEVNIRQCLGQKFDYAELMSK